MVEIKCFIRLRIILAEKGNNQLLVGRENRHYGYDCITMEYKQATTIYGSFVEMAQFDQSG